MINAGFIVTLLGLRLKCVIHLHDHRFPLGRVNFINQQSFIELLLSAFSVTGKVFIFLFIVLPGRDAGKIVLIERRGRGIVLIRFCWMVLILMWFFLTLIQSTFWPLVPYFTVLTPEKLIVGLDCIFIC